MVIAAKSPALRNSGNHQAQSRDDDQRANAAENHGGDGPKPLRGDARLELPKLVRRSNENHIDGRDASAHFVGSRELCQRGANDHADHVAGTQQKQRNQRKRQAVGETKDNREEPKSPDGPKQS